MYTSMFGEQVEPMKLIRLGTALGDGSTDHPRASPASAKARGFVSRRLPHDSSLYWLARIGVKNGARTVSMAAAGQHPAGKPQLNAATRQQARGISTYRPIPHLDR
jgi:hypothetical protein